MQNTTISATVDFAAQGIQHGFLKLPHSHDKSAWGCIMIPITVINNGAGPTALLTGGNHGDEYEGITCLLKLANSLKPEAIKGRVIIVPAMNYPAVLNGSRTSPIDNGNLNRAFPGNPSGTITQRIADYFTRYLVPLCDYALDIHSGGKTLNFLPFAASHHLDDPQQQKTNAQGALAFDAPNSMMMFELDATSLYDTVVEAQGKVFVTTEICGAGTSTPESIAMTDKGIHNFLVFADILQAQLISAKQPPRQLDMPDADCYMQSEHQGILEMCFSLGDTIESQELVARIYSLERTGEAPVEYYAKRSGILAARRHCSLINIGDTFAVLAEEVLNR
ncbi:MAG: N(2)-acetyl-L-2,4-diaminobutanoate deacetylase DoeB [Oceanospirillaceae bacterium]